MYPSCPAGEVQIPAPVVVCLRCAWNSLWKRRSGRRSARSGHVANPFCRNIRPGLCMTRSAVQVVRRSSTPIRLGQCSLLERLLHLVLGTGGFAGAHLRAWRVARGACSGRSITMSALTQEGVELRAMGSYLGSCSGCSINDQVVDIPQ